MTKRNKTKEELLKDVKASQAYMTYGLRKRREIEADPKKFAQSHGIPLERDRTPPPTRRDYKRPFFAHDSNNDMISELRDRVMKKDAQLYPNDPGEQMRLLNASNEDILKTAHDYELIDSDETKYLTERLSGKHHYEERTSPSYLSPLKERAVEPTPTARQLDQYRDSENNAGKALRRTKTRGVTPNRSAMRSATPVSEGSNLQALEERVNNSSSRARSVSAQRARPEGPLVNQVRSAMNTAQQSASSSSSSHIPARSSNPDEISDFAERLGASQPERRSVSIAPDVFDPRLGRIRPTTDPLPEKVSPYRTTPVNDPEDEEEYNRLSAQIPKNIEDSRSTDMTNRKFKDTLDLRKLGAEKKIEGYNADRTYFKNSMYVDPTELQEEAYDMIGLDDPYSQEKVDDHNELLRTLRPALTNNYASDAAAPFLKRMSENPANYHRDLMGNVEADHLDTINNRASREFNEKILPGIRAKYQSPGLLQHGHMDRDIGRASELAARGLHEANSQAALGIRGLTLNAGLQHANMQGQGASIAGNAAVKDSQSKLGAVKSARETQAEYSARKELQRLKKLEVGSIQRGEKIEKKKMMRDHLLKPEQDEQAHIERLALGMNAIRDPNIRTPADVEQKTPVTTGNNLKALSKAGGAGGRTLIKSDFESPDFAKGGIVKNKRLKRAEGGPVNSMTEEAIENAITQRTDPLAELRRLFNTDIRKTNPWETKKYYAIGGQVSPIEAGAEAAKEYSLQRAQISRMRQAPKKKPLWLEALDAGMSAAAGPDGGAFGNMASGWNSDLTRENAEKKERESKLTKADELEYQLEKDIAESAHKKRDMARQEMLAKAQMDHYGAQNTHLGLQGDKIRHEISSGGKKQNYRNLEEVKNAKKHLQANRTAKHAVIEAGEQTKSLPTGSTTGSLIEKLPWGLGSHAVAAFTPGVSAEQLQTAEGSTQSAFDAIIAARTLANKHKLTDTQLRTVGQGKQSVTKTPKQNASNENKILTDIKYESINDIKNMIKNNADPAEIEYEMELSGLTWDDLKSQSAHLGSQSSRNIPSAVTNGGGREAKLAELARLEQLKKEKFGR